MKPNIILDYLPEHTESGSKIRTDFRIAIKFEILMQDSQLTEEEKIYLSLNLFYEEEIEDIQLALQEIIWFYQCGKTETKTTTNSSSKSNQIYSFEYDAEYIFSAFMEQYNIDLNIVDMHWWKFKALFNSLNENVQFSKIMGYRAMDISKLKDKSQKEFYRKMKRIYGLPDMRTEEEKEADFANALW